HCHGVRRNIALLRDGEQCVHNIVSLFDSTHAGEDVAAQSDDLRVDPELAGVIQRCEGEIVLSHFDIDLREMELTYPKFRVDDDRLTGELDSCRIVASDKGDLRRE